MARTADVVVVGAGIIGCAIARELGRAGASVTVLETRSVGAGATQASAGVLAPYIEAHDRGALFTLTLRALEMYDRFVADVSSESGRAVEYRRCGTLEVATDAASAERLQRAGSAQPTAENARWLDAAAVRNLEPALDASIFGAVHVPAHGYVDARGLTDSLAASALSYGVRFVEDAKVESVQHGPPQLTVTTTGGDRMSAEHVVLAAGSWTGAIRDVDSVPVRPIRGQLLHLAWQGEPLSHVVWGPNCYVVPWLDGTVLVGATVEDVGFDERATAAGVRDLLEAACDLLPEGWRATFLGARAGLRPATPDGLPYIGRSKRMPRLVYATGHFRNGVLLAPLTAALVTELIVDGVEDPLLDLTRPDR